MKKNKILLLITIVIILFFLFKNLININKNENKSDKLLIVCTTSIIGSIVKSLLNENNFIIEILMGPGIDPHLYKAKSGDIYLLDESKVIFYNGLHLEGKMVEILENFSKKGKSSYSVTDCLDENELRRSEYENMYDPHVWFDVTLWKKVSIYIADCLKKNFKEFEKEIEKNCENLCNELDQLNNYIIEKINKIPINKRVLISAHDAFGYFGKRYNLKVEGLQGISTDAEITVNDIERVVETVMKYDINTIFVEKTVPEKYIYGIKDLAKIHGKDVFIGETLYSDSLGEDGSGAETYIKMFYKNIDAILKGLSNE